ncbi:PEGA domain-containing protein [candidate division KSB1 bacterium]|nr:PEGA domain-containing protein [candidate division KSB1 bacterium]RQW05678.1 MAG: PEGA domain-containing protein [candidate division KSB1 bacterium]
MNRFFLLFLVILTISCGVKQPVDQNRQHEFGSIIVTSTPPGGLIYLDGRNTTQVTPDTLKNIIPGHHTVRIFLQEYFATPDSIVLEVRANSAVSAAFTLEKLANTGWVRVESTPRGAEIVVDNQTTGKVTPDSLLLESGAHTVVFRKNGYQSRSCEVDVQRDTFLNLTISLPIQACVLLEAFGNVSCDPCVIAADNLDTFRENADPATYAIMEYYAWWPGRNDPFYKAASDDVDERIGYYQITALPSLVAGGHAKVNATDYKEIDATFKSIFAAHTTPIGLSITKNLIGTELIVQVEILRLSPCDHLEQLRLYVAIVENDIHFDSPPGSNGLTDFDFVFRGFLSSKTGDLFDTMQEEYQFTYRLTWPDWDYNKSQIVAFIQNQETKHIIHTTIH